MSIKEIPNDLPEMPMIEADCLSKFYGDFAAVRDVSFKIYRGEVVAFLGPNGAEPLATTSEIPASNGSRPECLTSRLSSCLPSS